MKSINHFGQHSNWKTHSSKEISDELDEGQNVLVAGWVHFLRDKGKLIFVQLRDATGICQILFKH